MMLSREQFLAPSKRRLKVLALPTGGSMQIQSLLESEMRGLRASLVDKKGELIRKRSERLHKLLITWCAVDETGNRLLTEDDALSTAMDHMDGAVVTFVAEECKKWTGFSNDGDWSAIEDAAKNSEATAAA